MGPATDWKAWHDAYADPSSALSRRLTVVQRLIRVALPSQPRNPVRVVSLCAGSGADLVGALDGYEHSRQVQARLVELDARNVATLVRSARVASLDLEIIEGDAAELGRYEGAVPADLVLLCGVLGNISDDDAKFTVRSMPQFCQTGATVIWTRTRRPPDLTGQIRGWFSEAGFFERAFVAPEDELFSVGAARFVDTPQPLGTGKLFTFIR